MGLKAEAEEASLGRWASRDGGEPLGRSRGGPGAGAGASCLFIRQGKQWQQQVRPATTSGIAGGPGRGAGVQIWLDLSAGGRRWAVPWLVQEEAGDMELGAEARGWSRGELGGGS